MIIAYKEHIQFIMILAVMYVTGVWFGPIIYVMFPAVILMLGLKERYFELLICALWMLILSDYIPVKNATHDDLQWAKDLKPLIPIALFGFFLLNQERFKPYPKFILYFIPFFIVAGIALNYSVKLDVGIRKTLSFILMYSSVPLYVNMLAKEQGSLFWKSLFTFIIGMLTIGVVLGFVAPQIGLLEGGGRFKGIFGNPNGLGVFLNLSFIMWIVIEEFKLAEFTKKERWYILFILVFSLLWCGSRNGIMSVVLFYLIYRTVKINWFFAIIVIISFIGFSEVIFDLFLGLVDFLGLQEYFRIDSLEAGSGREIAWIFAWSEIQHYFIVGGGFGHDENIMRPNYGWLSMQGHDGGVHNSYLSMWFDTGVIGVILYFGTLIRVYLSAFKFSYVVLAFAVSIFFNITYESWLVASLNPFTIMFLIILTIFAQKYAGAKYFENNDDYVKEPIDIINDNEG